VRTLDVNISGVSPRSCNIVVGAVSRKSVDRDFERITARSLLG
jgi:hypothetical protein